MPPNKPQSNYSKRPVRRVRLLKIGPRNTKSLFEEYFYAFVVSICVAVAILGKAGGLSGYDAIVTGLWAGGFTWFAWQVRRYRREQAGGESPEKSRRAVQAPLQITQQPLPPNMKPMIGPQWPLKTGGAPGPARPTLAPPNGKSKPAFVYERPTLPDRKPKLPANWPGQPSKKKTGQQDKKPKR